MNQVEIKNLAEQFAKLEKIIINTDSKAEMHSAMDEIIQLSDYIMSLEDMEAIDEEIQKILLSDS